MPANIHATEKPLFKIFSNDFIFSIPAYQRPYAWTEEEAGELLSDLLSFLEDSSNSIPESNPYFLGSIVLIKNESTPEADVIDGQQRLTTLTILLAVLRSLVSPERASQITEFICQPAHSFLGLDNCYRLKLRLKDNEFFRNYIQDGERFFREYIQNKKKGEIENKRKDEVDLGAFFGLNPSLLTDSQKNIQTNAKYFINKLQDFSEQKLDQFIKYLMTRCFLVVVSSPDFGSAYRIFSVLNSRGLNLSTPDILKSDIIGAIDSSLQGRYTKIWEDEEEALSRETFKDLFSHIRMISLKVKPRKDTLKEFRNKIKPEKTPQEFIDNTLKPYCDSLKIIKKINGKIYEGDDQNSKIINSLFLWLNKIDNFDWIPPAILYLSLNYHNTEKLKRFFSDLERLAAGLMILRADINDRINRYAKLLVAIQESTDLFTLDSPLQLSSDEKKRIIKTLDEDLYLMKRIRLYVLLRLDSALSAHDIQIPNDAFAIITVEHVLPQNPSDSWLEDFPNEQERNNYVHRIGNLALLSRQKNSEAQNFSFERKKSIYFSSNTGVVSFPLTIEVMQKDKWTPEIIIQRQESSLRLLKDIWRL